MNTKSFLYLFLLILIMLPLIALAGEGHEAGKKWAEKKDIDDENGCYSNHKGRWENDYISNSKSFTEGCLEHVEEQKEERKNENENVDEE